MYIFVGNHSEFEGAEYSRIGQPLAGISDERAHDLVVNEGVAALPEEDFKAIGFTAEEMHPRTGFVQQGKRVMRDGKCLAPAEFMDKHAKALARVHELRESAAEKAAQ